MGDQQTVSLPTDTDLTRLTKQRAVVESYLSDADARTRYGSTSGKLQLLQSILRSRTFEPDQTYELQCLGIVLGDAFVQELGIEWVMVEDEYGRDPAVRMPNTSIIMFPLTMISKRVERGEDVDVSRLFQTVIAHVQDVQRRGA